MDNTGAIAGHEYLRLAPKLFRASPSYQCCLADIKRLALEQGVFFSTNHAIGLLLSEKKRALSDSEQLSVLEQLTLLNVSISDLTEIAKDRLDALTVGNFWFLIKRKKILGSYVYSFDTVDAYRVGYMLSDCTKALVVPSWNEADWRQVRPIAYNVSYVEKQLIWNKYNDGFEYALVHDFTNRKDKYYGEHPLVSCTYNLIADANIGSLLARTSRVDTVAGHLFAIEGESFAQKKARDAVQKEWEALGRRGESPYLEPGKVFSEGLNTVLSDGNGKLASVLTYPHGTEKPPVHFTLEFFRDHNFLSWASEETSQKIFSVLGWSSELAGMRNVAGGLGSEKIKNLANFFNQKTIEPSQKDASNFLNWLLNQIGIDKAINFVNKTQNEELVNS